MKTLTIKKTWFSDSDLRLDASYHLSDGPLTKIKLKKSPYDLNPLSEETVNIFKGNIFKRIEISENEAEKILEFLYFLAKLTVNQYVNNKPDK